MGFFKKATNFLTHSQDLEDIICKAKEREARRDDAAGRLAEHVNDLYKARKRSYRRILELRDYVNTLTNHPDSLANGCESAIRLFKNIKEAEDWELSNTKDALSSDNKTSKLAMGGAIGSVAGGLTAALGPSAAMAFATTFGTASTGAAISALGGAAATNAALAWLGGGALAAGGAGVAGGAALLALFGPIGIGVGAISAIGASLSIRKRNDKQADAIMSIIRELDGQIQSLSNYDQKISTIIEKTAELTKGISIAKYKKFTTDYSDEDYPKKDLFETVDKAKRLGRLSQETIEGKSLC